MLFDRFGVAFGCHVGSILGAKIDPSRAKIGPRWLLKRYFLKNVNFHETSAGVMSGAFPGPQDGTQNDTKSHQDGSKTVLFRFFFRFVFCIDFWSLFGAILVPFWGVLGRLWEGQMGNFWHRFSHAIPRVRVHVRVGCARPCGCVLGAS